MPPAISPAAPAPAAGVAAARAPPAATGAGGPSFGLSEDQELLREQVRRFAEERIRPGVQERDRAHRFPAEIVGEMGEMGLLGMLGGEEDGGAGSDAGSVRTAARRDGDSWVLSGEKAWISNAGFARWYVVIARTDPAAGKRGMTAFAVPADAPGFAVGEPEEKLGLRASRTAPISFDNCRVAAENVLGSPGQGFKIALATLDHSRIGIAAQSVGIHQRALELAVAYARERVQFGVPIARHQAIRFRIAEMATELAAARLLTWRAAIAAGGAGAGAAPDAPEAGRLAAEAKLFASEAANHACQESLQIHGGNGFHDDYEISRLYRDVRVTTIYEGTSEMQRLVIARHLMLGS